MNVLLRQISYPEKNIQTSSFFKRMLKRFKSYEQSSTQDARKPMEEVLSLASLKRGLYLQRYLGNYYFCARFRILDTDWELSLTPDSVSHHPSKIIAGRQKKHLIWRQITLNQGLKYTYLRSIRPWGPCCLSQHISAH